MHSIFWSVKFDESGVMYYIFKILFILRIIFEENKNGAFYIASLLVSEL